MAAIAAALLMAGGAWAKAEPHPHVGRLPGFPVIRGVVPVLGSQAAISTHEKVVNEAFAEVRARRMAKTKDAEVTEPNEKFFSPCQEEAFFYSTQDVCYRGGPVLRDPTIRLIFWQGTLSKGAPVDPGVELFPAKYETIVEKYVEDIADASHTSIDTFSVDGQYGDESDGGVYSPGEYAMSFNSADVFEDTTDPFPTHAESKCEDKDASPTAPCLLDTELHEEVERAAKIKSWPTGNLNNIYVVLTPRGVGGCFEEESRECAYEQYCAYHGDFGGDGYTAGEQTIYADLPYIGEVLGCDFGVHPNEPESRADEREGKDSGADAVIDVASHELNEAITDPIGSQCKSGAKEASECERNAWTDVVGQEIADKCLPPEQTIDGIYGEPLGEIEIDRPASSYNEEISGGHYWTQRVWSNEAGFFEGGCVQRVIGVSVAAPSTASATVPVTLRGAIAGAPSGATPTWQWVFIDAGTGEIEELGTTEASIAHAFPKQGEYIVALTAYDGYGSSAWEATTVRVGEPPPPPTTSTVTVTTPPPAILTYTVAQMAEKLGLPTSGAKLSGLGTITLGHAQCPPACSVTLKLVASVTTGKGRGRKVKHETIGSLQMTIGAGGTASLSLKLNAKGRAALRKHHPLPVVLTVTVEGQEGGIWPIERELRLTSSASVARTSKHHR